MDLSEDFTLVRFAHWADGTQEYSDLFARAEQLGRQNDLQLSPSGRLAPLMSVWGLSPIM